MPRYKHLKTGKFVSEYYAKRHPKTTVRIDGLDAGALAESKATKFAERYIREHPETFKKLADS